MTSIKFQQKFIPFLIAICIGWLTSFVLSSKHLPQDPAAIQRQLPNSTASRTLLAGGSKDSVISLILSHSYHSSADKDNERQLPPLENLMLLKAASQNLPAQDYENTLEPFWPSEAPSPTLLPGLQSILSVAGHKKEGLPFCLIAVKLAAQEDPKFVIKLIETYCNAPMALALRYAVIEEWSSAAPKEALEFLLAREPLLIEEDSIIGLAVSRLATAQFSEALTLVDGNRDPLRREFLIGAVLGETPNNLKPAEYQEIFATYLAESSPTGMRNSENRFVAMLSFLRSVAQTDINLAKTYAEQSTSEHHYDEFMRAISEATMGTQYLQR